MLNEATINAEYKQAVIDLDKAQAGLLEACGESLSAVDWWSRRVLKHRVRVMTLGYVLEGNSQPING